MEHCVFRTIPLSIIRMELQYHPDPARKLSANMYDLHSEKLLMMDRGIVQNM